MRSTAAKSLDRECSPAKLTVYDKAVDGYRDQKFVSRLRFEQICVVIARGVHCLRRSLLSSSKIATRKDEEEAKAMGSGMHSRLPCGLCSHNSVPSKNGSSGVVLGERRDMPKRMD
mmetsp:Transcript_24396/g.57419  ORF Transcript_24396/g.57419 Transcript_24396/m.57419 type:complete len:116 (+) Transcript_24396:1854-2201(+)